MNALKIISAIEAGYIFGLIMFGHLFLLYTFDLLVKTGKMGKVTRTFLKFVSLALAVGGILVLAKFVLNPVGDDEAGVVLNVTMAIMLVLTFIVAIRWNGFIKNNFVPKQEIE